MKKPFLRFEGPHAGVVKVAIVFYQASLAACNAPMSGLMEGRGGVVAAVVDSVRVQLAWVLGGDVLGFSKATAQNCLVAFKKNVFKQSFNFRRGNLHGCNILKFEVHCNRAVIRYCR